MGRLREQFEPLPADHSLLNRATAMELGEDESSLERHGPHVVMRQLGIADPIPVEIRYEPTSASDVFVLATKGLHGRLERTEIERILRAPGSLMSRVMELVERAENVGQGDCTTVMVVEIK